VHIWHVLLSNDGTAHQESTVSNVLIPHGSCPWTTSHQIPIGLGLGSGTFGSGPLRPDRGNSLQATQGASGEFVGPTEEVIMFAHSSIVLVAVVGISFRCAGPAPRLVLTPALAPRPAQRGRRRPMNPGTQCRVGEPCIATGGVD
jgi:hypothetical protein